MKKVSVRLEDGGSDEVILNLIAVEYIYKQSNTGLGVIKLRCGETVVLTTDFEEIPQVL